MGKQEELALDLPPRQAPDIADCIWAAAFLCGEGHVNLTASRTGEVRAQVGVTNTDLAILDWYRERWGGHINKHGKLRSKHDNRRRLAFLWQISGQRAMLQFLQDIRPYLKLKIPQTDNCIAFLELRLERRPRQRRSATEKLRDAEFLASHRALDLTRGGQKPHRSSREVRQALGLDL